MKSTEPEHKRFRYAPCDLVLEDRMSKTDKKTLLGFGLVLLGIAALSDPQCKGGCRTWAEHLLSHGLQALL